MKESVRIQEEKRDKKLYAPIEYPVTLEESLNTKTKAELDAIRKFYGMQGVSTLKKGELIKVLDESIPNHVESFLTRIDEERIQIIRKILQNGGYYPFTGLTHKKISYFLESGIVAAGSIKGDKVLFIPADLIEQIKSLYVNTAVKQAVKQNTELISITKGILYYYGAITYNQLLSMMEELLKKPVSQRLYLDLLFDSKTYDSEIVFKDGYVLNHEVKDLDRLKKEHKMRPNIDYYPFKKEQLLKASEPGYIERNSSYQQLVQYMLTYYAIDKSGAEKIAGSIAHFIKIGNELGEVLKFIQGYIDFQDIEEIDVFMDPVVTLANNTKQWFLKGYAPYEIPKPSSEPTAVLAAHPISNVIDIKTKQKVGRNDPCPCGSGKKYKKCCGK